MPAPASPLPWGTKVKTWGKGTGATWGMKLSPAPAPEKKRRPFHRKPKPANHTNTLAIMSTFKYQPGPKAGGGLTTRTVLGEQIDEQALLAKIAADAGITSPQALLAIQSLFAEILAAAADSRWSDGLFGLFRFRPSSGGTGMSPGDFNTADDINADIALSLLAEVIATWRQTLTLASQGEVGLVKPVIDKVINLANGHEDEYTAADMMQFRGDNLRVDKSDPLQGVFVIKADGTEQRCSVYGTIDPKELQALMPSGITGPVGVRIAVRISGTIRSATYVKNITPSV